MNHITIQTFLTIATCNSLSQAADSLFITQPALSHRLSSLEQELGTSLIVRNKGVRTIELTEAGKRFLPLAEKWQTLWKETQEINFSVPVTPLRVSNVDSLNETFMPMIYSKFLLENRGCRLNISTLRSNAAYRSLENHEIDVGLITNPHFFKKVRTLPLFSESMKFICNMDATYPDTLSPHDLDPQHEIYIPWGNSFHLWHDYWFGNHLDIRISIDNMGLFEELLKLPDSWAIVPSTLATLLLKKGTMKTCQLSDGPDHRTCYVITDSQNTESPLQDKFIETVLQIVGSYSEIEILV